MLSVILSFRLREQRTSHVLPLFSIHEPSHASVVVGNNSKVKIKRMGIGY
jgi:hypothetical protein